MNMFKKIVLGALILGVSIDGLSAAPKRRRNQRVAAAESAAAAASAESDLDAAAAAERAAEAERAEAAERVAAAAAAAEAERAEAAERVAAAAAADEADQRAAVQAAVVAAVVDSDSDDSVVSVELKGDPERRTVLVKKNRKGTTLSVVRSIKKYVPYERQLAHPKPKSMCQKLVHASMVLGTCVAIAYLIWFCKANNLSWPLRLPNS